MKIMNSEHDERVEEREKVYTEILEVCNKYRDFSNRDNVSEIRKMIEVATNNLTLIGFYEKYGLQLHHDLKP